MTDSPSPGGAGRADLDAEHRALLALYDSIRQRLEAGGQASRDFAGACRELEAFAREHFAWEEALMERTDFPDRLLHRRLHETLSAQLSDITAFVTSGDGADGMLAGYMLLGFIGKWLRAHVDVLDRRLAEHLALVSGMLGPAAD